MRKQPRSPCDAVHSGGRVPAVEDVLKDQYYQVKRQYYRMNAYDYNDIIVCLYIYIYIHIYIYIYIYICIYIDTCCVCKEP